MDMRSRPSRPLFLLISATVFALVVSASENKIDVLEEQHYSQADLLWFKQVKAEYEDDAWDWYQQNAADPTAARKQRRTMPDSTAYQITWARVAMGIDEIMYAASGITPDFIVSSVELELIRSRFTDAMASQPLPVAEPGYRPRTSQPEIDAAVWTQYDDLLGEHAALRGRASPPSAVDLLWAVLAVDMDQRVMEQTHITAYRLMTTVEYQVLRKIAIDMEVDAIVHNIEACLGVSDDNAKECLNSRDFTPTTCANTANFCHDNAYGLLGSGRGLLGVCDIALRRCR